MRPSPLPRPETPAAGAATDTTPRLGQSLRDGWRLVAPFWRDRAERLSWLLLAAVVGLTLAGVGLNVLFSTWNNRFYDTLQNHDLPGFWRQVGVFGALAVAAIVAAVYRQYLQQVLFMRWRTWLTHRLQRQWLQPGVAYRMGVTAPTGGLRVDNPDQRVAEDARDLVSGSLGLALGLLNAGVTLLSFVGILWGLSGTLVLPLGHGLPLPGYMVWVALAYAGGGSLAARWLGRPLVGLNFQQQQREADFRYALVQLREQAEAVGLAAGEAREQQRLVGRFDAVRGNWARLIRTTKRLTWFSAGYGQLANVFPLLAAAPRYFSGAIALGGLMQTAQAFGQVQGALSWFIDAVPELTQWQATVQRLTGFEAAALALHTGAAALGEVEPAARVQHQQGPGPDLVIGALRLHLPGNAPDGRVLALPAQRLVPGERVLLSGPSGIGKSALLRALAGLWRDGQGQIHLPAGGGLMFLPQRPYLPDGPLREVLAYPHGAANWADAALAEVLVAAGLARLVPSLDEARAWGRVLSPGEQQRVQFARVFLQRPRWLFMDESTSALDPAAEAALYAELLRRCPDSAVLSVGHRDSLRAWHHRCWRIPAAAVADACADASADASADADADADVNPALPTDAAVQPAPSRSDALAPERAAAPVAPAFAVAALPSLSTPQSGVLP